MPEDSSSTPHSASSKRAKLTISEEDLLTPAVEERVRQLEEAAVPQLVRSVGSPDQVLATPWWRRSVVTMLLLGLAGGFVGFAVSELLMGSETRVGLFIIDDPAMSTALWLALYALGIAAVLGAWEGIEARSPQKAGAALGRSIPVVLGLGGLAGAVAQAVVFEPIMERAWTRAVAADVEAQADTIMMGALRTGRAFGFLVVGAAIGVALGAASRSGKRALNGALGGAVAGFIGGFAFDTIGEIIGGETGTASRLFTLTLIGGLTGLAIGLVEQARKDHWIEIVSGGMAGKQFILYHAITLVGAAPGCHLTLIKDPQVAPEHLLLSQSSAGLRAQSRDSHRPVLVNGVAAVDHCLADGDLLQVGSTVLRYRQRDQVVPELRTA